MLYLQGRLNVQFNCIWDHVVSLWYLSLRLRLYHWPLCKCLFTLTFKNDLYMMFTLELFDFHTTVTNP